MPTPSEAFGLARKLHQAGNLRQAEQLYRQVLQADPAQGEVWLLLGNAQQRLGKGAEAYFSMGMAQAESGDRGGAIESYRQALGLNPTHVEAMTGLGTALAEQGNLEEAVAHLRKAIQCRPEFA